MADRILFLETPDIQKTPVGEKNEYTAAEKQKLSGIEAGAQKNTVDSVNGKTGPVTLDAADVGALPSDTPIPAAVTEQTVAGWGFTKNTGDYSKPSGGIPKTDLASDVRTSLGKADSALQEHQSLAAYRTSADQDTIDAAQNTAIAEKYTKPSGGIPESDLAEGVIPTIPITSVSVNGVKQTPVGGNVDIDVPTGGSVAEKTLAQRGFRYFPSLNGSAPDYYVSITTAQASGDVQNYAPEDGSILAVRAPTTGIVANATLKFRVSTKYSASWPIYLRNSEVTADYVKPQEIMLLMFSTNKFYIVGVVRDPITVPTKLSDLENDLNLTGIQEIDLSSAAQSLNTLLAANKTAITGTDGEKTTFYRGHTFASVVYDVASAFSDSRLPVISLGVGTKFPVTACQYDGETENAWFSVKMSETEMSGTSLIGYTHEIVVALVGIVIHTQKYEIDVQTLPSGS